MRLASFNLENLFDRVKAFDLNTIAEGRTSSITSKAKVSALRKTRTRSGVGRQSEHARFTTNGESRG